jgi:putative ABC transport system substrate-binding protein
MTTPGGRPVAATEAWLCLVVALSILAASLAVAAEQAQKIARIGWLAPATPAAQAHLLEAFRQGLRELGHVEGKTFVLVPRYSEVRAERLPEMARELVSLKVDVIVALGDIAIATVKQQTRTIPIVMAASTDPLGTGLVASLARPGGNLTGLSMSTLELSGKRLELLKEVVPTLSRVAFLWNSQVRGAVLDYNQTEGASRSLGLQLQSVEAARTEDFDRAFSAITEQRAQALIVASPNPVTFTNRRRIASFAQSTRLPSMYANRDYVDAGGLMAYGPSVADLYRGAATFTDKILKGAKPADSARRPDRTRGGPGVGDLCSVCDLPVTREELEFGIQFERDGDNPGLDKFHVHVRCFAAWEFERTKAQP